MIAVATGTPTTPDDQREPPAGSPQPTSTTNTDEANTGQDRGQLDTILADSESLPRQDDGTSDRRLRSTPLEPLEDLSTLALLIAPRTELVQETPTEPDKGGDIQTDSLRRATQEMRDQIDNAAQDDKLSERATDLVLRASGTSISVGSLAWLLRGGSLFASALSSVPTWAGFDPLPVLARNKKDVKKASDNPDEELRPGNVGANAGRILDSVSDKRVTRAHVDDHGADS